jgi:hypothetical protein
MDFGEMTLTRTEQGTPDDKALALLAEAMVRQGLKVNATAYKLHKQQIVFTMLFEGFRIAGFTYPSFDVNGEDKFTISYTCTCDNWVRL